MPISVLCPKCGKKLNAPDTASGKRAKCPACGQIMQIPEIVHEAEEVTDDFGLPDLQGSTGGFSADDFDDTYGIAGERMSRESEPQREPNRRPCPACGEMIVLGAAKCRFCDEIFDATLKRRDRKRGSDVDDDLTGGDWAVAILCSAIGCIAGIVWMIQGKKKGAKMIGVSLLCAFGWNVLKVMIGVVAQP